MSHYVLHFTNHYSVCSKKHPFTAAHCAICILIQICLEPQTTIPPIPWTPSWKNTSHVLNSIQWKQLPWLLCPSLCYSPSSWYTNPWPIPLITWWEQLSCFWFCHLRHVLTYQSLWKPCASLPTTGQSSSTLPTVPSACQVLYMDTSRAWLGAQTFFKLLFWVTPPLFLHRGASHLSYVHISSAWVWTQYFF